MSWIDAHRLPQLLQVSNAAERLREAGPDAITELINHAGSRIVGNLLKALPRIQGFNRGTENEKKRQKREIVKAALAGPSEAQSAYWRAYRDLWSLASAQRLGSRWSFEPRDERLAGPDAARTLATALTPSEQDDQPLSRETLSEILVFSPLELDDASRAIVASARSAADIERAARLEGLPTRFDELAASVERQSAELRELSESRQGSLTELRREIAGLRSLLAVLGEQVTGLSGTADEVQAKSSTALTDLAQTLREAEARVDLLASKDSVETVVSFVAALESRVDALEQKTAAALKDASRALADRAALPPAPAPRTDDMLPSLVPSYRVVRTAVGGGSLELTSWVEVFESLRRWLEFLGLGSGDALTYGMAMTAALRAGQAPVLGGSVASTFALALAERALGTPALLAQIPLGCRSPLTLERVHAEGARCVIIAGVSQSPFETVGGEIRDAVLRSQMGWESPSLPATLAAFETGGAALPLSAGVLELGPYLDLDTVTWSRRVRQAVKESQLSDALLESRAKEDLIDQAFFGEIEPDIVSMSITGTGAWRPSMQRFFAALRSTSNEVSATFDAEQAAEVMYRCWILPMLSIEESDKTSRAERLRALSSSLSAKAERLLHAPTLRAF